jgi:hypothetical protein
MTFGLLDLQRMSAGTRSKILGTKYFSSFEYGWMKGKDLNLK